jgi:peptidoglycan-associated lipoprotein
MRTWVLQNFGMVGLLGAHLLGGCSSFHNVAIVSHGDEIAGESRDSPAPPEPTITLSSAPATTSDDPSGPVVSEPPRSQTVLPSKDSAISAQSADDSMLPWTLKDVYFDYDQYTIRRDTIPALQQNVKVLLKRYATREVLIEGHCDERGTEEYNLILGERRAMAVKTYLVDLGVPASKLRVLSLGKNEPFCLQLTPTCFQQNRRAHFVLK